MARDDRPDRTEDWRLHAACRPHDSELFFPDRAAHRTGDVARAKAVCRACPVREACLQAAMDGREKAGIWGGLTPQERANLRRRERRTRDKAAAIITPEPKPATGPVRRAAVRSDATVADLRGDQAVTLRGGPVLQA